jgi:hypothetical protein
MKKNMVTVFFCAILAICVENSRGMVLEEEGFSFFTPIEGFVNLSCDQIGAVDVAQTWAALVTMFKSNNYGGRGCIDKDSASGVGMFDIFEAYFKHFQCNGFYDQDADHEADGILGKYPGFAEAFGNTNDPSKLECYYVAAKNDGEDLSYRRKEDMLNGIGEDFTLDCDGGMGNTRKVNACLQLLLLTEIAERGKASCYLYERYYGSFPSGYSSSTFSKFYRLMSIIME